MDKRVEKIKNMAEADLKVFAKLVQPQRLYGEMHDEAFDFLQEEGEGVSPNKLILLPRAHMKSHCVAVWCAWKITKQPEVTMLYLTATTPLAEAQLAAIKAIIDSDIYRRYWPDMLEKEEGKRDKWSARAIAVDHPKRKEEGIRDATVETAGLNTNIIGLHADIVVCDDVVTKDNTATGELREKVASQMSLVTSILNPGGIVRGCGTRYHPADQYSVWKEQQYTLFDDEGEAIGEQMVWDIMERVVETDDVFLWPRKQRSDGKWFGFNKQELARIRAQYSDRLQFYAQYYNNPNDPDGAGITPELFQYYSKTDLTQEGTTWYHNGRRLSVYAAMDFAYSKNKRSDYTALVVVGVDSGNNVYVLDIVRFKTDKVIDYFKKIKQAHERWRFNKLRIEVTAAQQTIGTSLKEYVRADGMFLTLEAHKPTRASGSKEERMSAALEPKYQNGQMFHYKGGLTTALEEELLLARPKHDDMKDALASALEIIAKPAKKKQKKKKPEEIFHSRFGGVSHINTNFGRR